MGTNCRSAFFHSLTWEFWPCRVRSAPGASSREGWTRAMTRDKREKTLYVWAGDQARVAPDFLAVIDFDEESRTMERVIRTVPIPSPGNVGNESHHCHLSADKNILACGGLLSLLSGQNSIFFFDVSDARHPKFLFSANAAQSSITDDFLPLDGGGFLVTQMGSATGGAPGRVAEFDSVSTGRGVAHQSSAGRLQPTRDLRAPGPEPDGDVGLHPAGEHVECLSRAIRYCAVRFACGIWKTGRSYAPSRSRVRWAPWM